MFLLIFIMVWDVKYTIGIVDRIVGTASLSATRTHAPPPGSSEMGAAVQLASRQEKHSESF